ncbi:hypothetical protein [Desulfitobacterium hafniense]|uniref:hypothetical protein n=1 Tax=Desulfitobacterium hafniense TaxID=49338 RepID=UPI00037FB9AE|nr:hypothetical protein [Desulfitobacterium hafniense]
MEALKVDDLTKAVVYLIRAGVILRIGFCLLRMIGSQEEASMYKKRAINAGIFLVIAESIWQLISIVFYYYS